MSSVYDVITVKFEKLIMRKPENEWSIIKTNIGTCKGVIPWVPVLGDLLRLEGRWEISSFSGSREFSFKAVMPDLPEDTQALLAYAVSITKGMGAAAELYLWETYGDKWKTVQEPVIPRITEETLFNWQDTLRRLDEHKAKSAIIAALMAKGCTLNMSAAAYEEWKEQAFARISQDPYMLSELPHYGFTHVDESIRKNFGIEDNDPRRLDSAVIYVLKRSCDGGNTITDVVDVKTELVKICPDCSDRIEESFSRLVQAGKISVFAPTAVCLMEDWNQETAIWQRFGGDYAA